VIGYAEFFKEAQLFGVATKKFVVISHGENLDALDSWLDYCGRKADETRDPRWGARAEFFRRQVEGGKGLTVPCGMAHDFEPGLYRARPYRPRPVVLRGSNKAGGETSEHRRQVVADWRGRKAVEATARAATAGAGRSPTFQSQPETPAQRLERLARENRESPAVASPELARRLGANRPPPPPYAMREAAE
jgi:hypothetical protein